MKNFLQNAHPLNVKFDDDFVKYYSKPYQEHELILSIDHDNAKLILTYANHQFEYLCNENEIKAFEQNTSNEDIITVVEKIISIATLPFWTANFERYISVASTLITTIPIYITIDMVFQEIIQALESFDLQSLGINVITVASVAFITKTISEKIGAIIADRRYNNKVNQFGRFHKFK